MSNDIRDIIERLAILEGRITPVDVKHGLNADQKAVKQLPALFKPKDISPTLSKAPYQKHPMDGWLVGEEIEDNEEADKEVVESSMSNIDYLMQEIGIGDVDIYDIYTNPKTPEEQYASKIVNRMYDDIAIDRGLHPDDDFEKILDIVADQISQDYPMDNPINEAKANEEKLLDKVTKSLKDYLASIEDKPKDRDLSNKKKIDRDISKKDSVDHDLIPRAHEVESIAVPEYGTSIKTITFEDGRICEIHGNEGAGFAIKHGNNTLPSRFRSLDEAELAIEMYRARCRKNNESADYINEA